MTDFNAELEKVIERWTNAEEIRLRAGEIDPEEMRTVLAVTRGFAYELIGVGETLLEYQEVYDGDSVVVPKSQEHANSMIMVANAYGKTFT
jgi:hypothetical protein